METKQNEYARVLIGKMGEIFDLESDWYISMEDLQDGENASAFFHALATMMPTYFFNKITTQSMNYLEFNHVANHLVFQYATRVESSETDE